MRIADPELPLFTERAEERSLGSKRFGDFRNWPAAGMRCVATFRPVAGAVREYDLELPLGFTVGQSFTALPRRVRCQLAQQSQAHHRPRCRVSNRAFNFGMPEKQLHGSEVAGSFID